MFRWLAQPGKCSSLSLTFKKGGGGGGGGNNIIRSECCYHRPSFSRAFTSSKGKKWETIVGLEIHSQLASRKKLFSEAKNDSDAIANTQWSLFDAAVPGTLPIIDMECVELAIRAAIIFNSQVALESYFDRKHYKYPDLPAGFQITQHFHPFAKGGLIETLEGPVRIKQLQLEQDSAKSLCDEEGRLILIDLNRCGVGLVEIVTEPDIRSAAAAVSCARKIWEMLVDAKVCTGILAQGHLRFDVNVSVVAKSSDSDSGFEYSSDSGSDGKLDAGTSNPSALGVPVEIKNLNTFSSLQRAIQVESLRQIKILESGGKIIRETRSYDERKRITNPSREKENALDYRFIPEFDLPPLRITKEWINQIRDNIPESRSLKYNRMSQLYGLNTKEVTALMTHEGLLELFEQCCMVVPSPRLVFNFLTNKYLGVLTRRRLSLKESPITREHLLKLLKELSKGSIDNHIAQETLYKVISGDESPIEEIISGFLKMQTTNELPNDMVKVLLDTCKRNPKKVDQVLKGGIDDGAVDSFVGPLMKINNERVSPVRLRSLALEYIVRSFPLPAEL